MKRKFLIIIILIFAVIAASCNIPGKNKPSNYYYTAKLLKIISEDKNFQIKVLDMSYYKIKNLSNEETGIVLNFLNTVNKEDFKRSEEIKSKPVYRIYINFKDETYIADIFNKDDIAIFPYDDNLEQDVIKMNSKYKCYNLYYLCRNIFN